MRCENLGIERIHINTVAKVGSASFLRLTFGRPRPLTVNEWPRAAA